jgi:hypothetical protein
LTVIHRVVKGLLNSARYHSAIAPGVKSRPLSAIAYDSAAPVIDGKTALIITSCNKPASRPRKTLALELTRKTMIINA